jgi:hypothetical protein
MLRKMMAFDCVGFWVLLGCMLQVLPATFLARVLLAAVWLSHLATAASSVSEGRVGSVSLGGCWGQMPKRQAMHMPGVHAPWWPHHASV